MTLFNTKSIHVEEKLWYYFTYSLEGKGVSYFSQGYQSEIDRNSAIDVQTLTTVQQINHYATGTPPNYNFGY